MPVSNIAIRALGNVQAALTKGSLGNARKESETLLKNQILSHTITQRINVMEKAALVFESLLEKANAKSGPATFEVAEFTVARLAEFNINELDIASCARAYQTIVTGVAISYSVLDASLGTISKYELGVAPATLLVDADVTLQAANIIASATGVVTIAEASNARWNAVATTPAERKNAIFAFTKIANNLTIESSKIAMVASILDEKISDDRAYIITFQTESAQDLAEVSAMYNEAGAINQLVRQSRMNARKSEYDNSIETLRFVVRQ